MVPSQQHGDVTQHHGVTRVPDVNIERTTSKTSSMVEEPGRDPRIIGSGVGSGSGSEPGLDGLDEMDPPPPPYEDASGEWSNEDLECVM